MIQFELSTSFSMISRSLQSSLHSKNSLWNAKYVNKDSLKGFCLFVMFLYLDCSVHSNPILLRFVRIRGGKGFLLNAEVLDFLFSSGMFDAVTRTKDSWQEPASWVTWMLKADPDILFYSFSPSCFHVVETWGYHVNDERKYFKEGCPSITPKNNITTSLKYAS